MSSQNSVKPVFCQLVVGPPGSGKTTYCVAMQKYLKDLGRTPIIINLDLANDVSLPYKPNIDVNILVTVQDVMENLKLGPNGALVYSMDYLEANFAWLQEEIIKAIQVDNPYILIDCPGQVELYTQHDSMKNIVKMLKGEVGDRILDLRMACINLVDSHYANDAAKFISILLTSLSTMLHLELPHLNVLSKADLMGSYGRLSFGLDFYCDVLDLSYLVDQIADDRFLAKRKKLSQSLAGLVQDYGLVSFIPLNINNAKSVIATLRKADKANGFYMTEVKEERLTDVYNAVEEVDYEQLL